jgi:hypothetical protein
MHVSYDRICMFRVAKIMKKKLGQNAIKGRKKPDVYLKHAIEQSNRTKENSKKGIQVFTVTHSSSGADTIYYKHNPAALVAAEVVKVMAPKKKMPEEDVAENLEYVPGTVIYYGAKVALQARHGGYLSYHNATEIKGQRIRY